MTTNQPLHWQQVEEGHELFNGRAQGRGQEDIHS